MGHSGHKAHLYPSVQAEVFIRRERGQTKRSGERTAKFSTCRRAQSIPIRQVRIGCALPGLVILASSHPESALLLKVSKSLGTGLLEGRGLYLLKLAPRILIGTYYSSVSYILARISTYRNYVKRMVRWVTIFHGHIPGLWPAQMLLSFSFLRWDSKAWACGLVFPFSPMES